MRPTNMETAKKRTSKLQKEVKESINQIGRKAFRYILQNYFAL